MDSLVFHACKPQLLMKIDLLIVSYFILIKQIVKAYTV